MTDLRDRITCHERDEDHCAHWQEGDGDCCQCGEPNWCPDDGEDAADYVPDGAI